MARLRPQGPGASATFRFRSRPSAGGRPRERPMIALLLAQTIAITGGTVYPVSGPRIERATVVIRDGRILAVGPRVPIPQGATIIDASNRWVTPGLIDGAGQTGLVEIGAVPGTQDAGVHDD